MNTGPMILYAPPFEHLMTGVLRLPLARLSAVLLDGRYVPDMSQHDRYSHITPYELSGGDYGPVAVAGVRVEPVPGGAAFFTDPIIWGDPVDLPPARFLALLMSLPGKPKAEDALFGLVDLSPAGGAVEAQRGAFGVSPPTGGWFTLTAQPNS
ncbi:hypothetical protein [Kordiimonas aestuarii]|uniref:hypothetical protein n=1 Tax=Kordiimonas aestuarii TaxID=1005925 RepID=UPI0021CF56DA|nr:hypothetical protein [Kordiimonas aestuarii]